MALGVLGPVIEVDYDEGESFEEREICLITHCIFPSSVKQATLELKFEIKSSDSDPFSIEREREFEQAEDESNLAWGAFIPLKFKLGLSHGARASAVVRCGETSNWSELNVQVV